MNQRSPNNVARGIVATALSLAWLIVSGCETERATKSTLPTVESDGAYHVREGGNIQQALDAAASDAKHKRVVVHEGIYRPSTHGPAFLRFYQRHDGISLVADGQVTLTAANPAIANRSMNSYPAVVNHVVYFGHGVTDATELRGFTITGANGFVAESPVALALDPPADAFGLRKGLFFERDGGAIKVFGDSHPKLVDLRIVDNSTTICGGGISIEHQGYCSHPVQIQACIFRNNRCPGTGAAVDVLSKSSAHIEDCLFVENIANTGMDEIARQWGLTYHEQYGSGALTVFPESKVVVRRCTFANNWNGVDDAGLGSIYEDCIFWMNNASDGSRPGPPYELDIVDASNVKGCWINGQTSDLRGTIDSSVNILDAPDPQFDTMFRPLAAEYANAGYRPTTTPR